MKVTLNKEKNGIEIRFDSKPDSNILASLKANGFRWHGKMKMWYAKQSADRMKFVNQISGESMEIPEADKAYSLWDMTRTDSLGENSADADLHDIKGLTAMFRKHLRARFPMVRFSIRFIRHDSVSAEIVSSPFPKDSKYLEAIKKYTDAFINSFCYCTYVGDPYQDIPSDYNFYFFGCRVDYDYTETQDDTAEMIADFDAKEKAWEEAEEARKEEEFRKWQEERAKEEEEHKKYMEKKNREKEYLLANIEVKECDPYFVGNLRFANLNKNCTLDEYKEHCDLPETGEWYHQDAMVTKDILFTDEKAYAFFSNMLLDDFDFIAGTGGSATDDERVNEYKDFLNMDSETRKTVKWYCDNAVAVYLNGSLMFVIDAQGYSYARYVGMVYPETVVNQQKTA